MAARTVLDPRARDLTGMIFGKLTVLSPTDKRVGEFVVWQCLCECGNVIEASSSRLRPGRTWHCGCTKAPRAQRSDREYRIWCDLRNRCNNPNNGRYARYGGRGIAVCERWNAFANFLADMGRCPVGMTIDRIDNDGPYDPSNCRWATYVEQGRHMSRNHMVTFEGETMCIAEWSDRVGISQALIESRLNQYGWTVERALTQRPRRMPKRSADPKAAI